MSEHAHGDISRTRTPEQAAAYGKTVGQGLCPFCGKTEDMPEEIRSRMIHVGSHWRAWHNPFKYSGHATHIVLAPIEHLTQPKELSPESLQEWMDFNVRLIDELQLPGGGLVMRFGSNESKGGSITHLHSHIQVPDRLTFAIATFFADDALKSFFAEQSSR